MSGRRVVQRVLAPLLVVILMAIGIVAWLDFTPSNHTPRAITVPRVVGMTTVKAESALRTDHLAYQASQSIGGKIIAGDRHPSVVFAQQPAAGTEVTAHTTIALFTGPGNVAP